MYKDQSRKLKRHKTHNLYTMQFFNWKIEMVKPKLQKCKEQNSLFNKVSFTDTFMFRLKNEK